jgi:hypothetical protein
MDTFLYHPTTHNHAPNPDRIPVIQLHNEVKQHAATTDEPTSSILHSTLRTFPLRAACELPRTDIIMQTIRRQRATVSVISDGHLSEGLKKLTAVKISYYTNTMNVFLPRSRTKKPTI